MKRILLFIIPVLLAFTSGFDECYKFISCASCTDQRSVCVFLTTVSGDQLCVKKTNLLQYDFIAKVSSSSRCAKDPIIQVKPIPTTTSISTMPATTSSNISNIQSTPSPKVAASDDLTTPYKFEPTATPTINNISLTEESTTTPSPIITPPPSPLHLHVTPSFTTSVPPTQPPEVKQLPMTNFPPIQSPKGVTSVHITHSSHPLTVKPTSSPATTGYSYPPTQQPQTGPRTTSLLPVQSTVTSVPIISPQTNENYYYSVPLGAVVIIEEEEDYEYDFSLATHTPYLTPTIPPNQIFSTIPSPRTTSLPDIEISVNDFSSTTPAPIVTNQSSVMDIPSQRENVIENLDTLPSNIDNSIDKGEKFYEFCSSTATLFPFSATQSSEMFSTTPSSSTTSSSDPMVSVNDVLSTSPAPILTTQSPIIHTQNQPNNATENSKILPNTIANSYNVGINKSLRSTEPHGVLLDPENATSDKEADYTTLKKDFPSLPSMTVSRSLSEPEPIRISNHSYNWYEFTFLAAVITVLAILILGSWLIYLRCRAKKSSERNFEKIEMVDLVSFRALVEPPSTFNVSALTNDNAAGYGNSTMQDNHDTCDFGYFVRSDSDNARPSPQNTQSCSSVEEIPLTPLCMRKNSSHNVTRF